jgi:O-antigen ligase
LELEMDDATGIWRLEKWKEGWALFLASPVLGQGFGRPVNTLKMERPVSDDEFNLGLPHNTFLVSLVRQGILGTSVLLGVVGVWFWVTIKSLRTASPPTRRDMVTLIAIVVMCLPYGFFSLFFESPYLAFPFWATIGLGMVLAGRATE